MNPERWAQIKAIFYAAAEQPADERAAFIRSECNGDESLAVEIESLLGAHDQAVSFIEGLPNDPTTAALDLQLPDTMIGRRIGAYEVIRELGRGGMGAVYLASRADEEFRKLVAIKLVKAGLDNESIIRRFRNERQILASLDHPNIARLLDGGTTEDGSPFFVMEYIEGKPIRDYCDARRLSTDERLRLFRDVCSAVHYSHQNLIVHRDLKPSNILITEEGTVKLLDFGIAKLIGASGFGETTLATARVMTPEYASPEQARGEAITTSSDVYSLGVLLYELLSGHRPYHVDTTSPLEMIQAICEQEPQMPSTAVGRTETTNSAHGEVTLTPEAISKARASQPDKLRRQLEGDLDNIVLKAMRKEPQRRYTSVEQFSEDLRTYLEGRPVIARRDTFSYRAGKFVRRNKIGVTAAAIILILLVAGVAGIARQTVVPNRQRARAEKRFNEVRELAHSFMFTFHDAIRNLAGATAARQLVVNESLQYLNSLADESSDDPSLQRELAEAYHKLAEIQGVPGISNLGDKAGAAESFKKAIAIRESLVASGAATAEDRRNLAESYIRLCSVIPPGPENLESALKGQAILEKLLAADPDNETLLTWIGTSYQSVGQYSASSGDNAGALTHYRKMQAIYQSLVESNPANVNNRHNLAYACKKVGGMLIVTGDLESAGGNYARALEIEKAMTAADPDNATLRLDMSYTLSDLALIRRKSNDYPGALNFARESMAIREELCAADPKDKRARTALAAIYSRVGNILSWSEDYEDALRYIKKGLEIREAPSGELQGDKNSISEEYCSIGMSHAAAAESPKVRATERRRHWQEARSAFQRALEMKTQLVKQDAHPSPECTPEQLTQRIAKCDAEIGKRQ